MTFDLRGNFHRDIRGAKIRFQGNGDEDDPHAASYMDGFALRQTGKVGDITAGDPPADYLNTPYLEVYSDQNGRIVIELDRDHMQVIGRPIPACESDPISREEQARNMAEFLSGISTATQVTAMSVGPGGMIVSDPEYTHWVVVDGQIAGEAHSVEPASNGQSFAYIRLFNIPEMNEYGYIETARLRSKQDTSSTDTSACDSPDSNPG